MKKLLFTTAIVSLLFAGCDKNNNGDDPNDPSTETVKLLPSKIINGRDTTGFEYDGQNRLIRIVGMLQWSSVTPTVIMYDANNNPTNVGGRSFRYVGNQIFDTRLDGYSRERVDTLTINANGRLEKIKEFVTIKTFTYDSRGSLTKIVREHDYGDEIYRDTIEFEHANSNARSIWRHVNVPDWFVVYVLSDLSNFHHRTLSVTTTKNGLMPTLEQRFSWENEIRFDYGIYPNGYISHITVASGSESPRIYAIEWIPAK